MPNWERFGHTWDQLGRKNALGAILTVDGKVADWNIGEFLATGRIDVGRFMPRRIRGSNRGRALG